MAQPAQSRSQAGRQVALQPLEGGAKLLLPGRLGHDPPVKREIGNGIAQRESTSENSGWRRAQSAAKEQAGTTRRPLARAVSNRPSTSRDPSPWPLNAGGTST